MLNYFFSQLPWCPAVVRAATRLPVEEPENGQVGLSSVVAKARHHISSLFVIEVVAKRSGICPDKFVIYIKEGFFVNNALAILVVPPIAR